MQITDPVADMLTRIRNANTVGHETVEIPASNIKKSIAEILKTEGFIADYTYEKNSNGDKLTLTVWRDGKTQDIEVTLQEQPTD